MTRTFRAWLRRLQYKWFACGVFVVGCTHTDFPTQPAPPPLRPLAESPYASGVHQVGYQEPAPMKVDPGMAEELPDPKKQPEDTIALPKEIAPVAEGEVVPISLDTLFRLAEMHNARIGLSRERLHESSMEHCRTCSSWLPKITAGIGYYRHEGGIQNENGTLTHSSTGALYPGIDFRGVLDPKDKAFRQVQARRAVWQRRGELRKVENEVFLEAANLYVDLLSARQAEATVREIQGYFEELLDRGEKLLEEDKRARILVEASRAEVSGRKMARTKLKGQGEAAGAKLAYLLGLGHVQPTPMESRLVPIDLVDPTPSSQVLVHQALRQGPGVHELRGLLGVIHGGIAQLENASALVPKIELSATEGAFGAGPGGTLDWDNRLDIGIQARWDITSLFSARDVKLAALSKLRQAELTLADLQGKLAAGVRASRSISLQGRKEILEGAQTIEHAAESYKLSKERLKERIQGASFDEVFRAIRGLEQAHLNYLKAVNAYNKAQIQLMLLLGGSHSTARTPPPGTLPMGPAGPGCAVPTVRAHQPR